MSKTELPDHLDAYKLADQQVSLSGLVSSARLTRLSGAVLRLDEHFDVQLAFFVDEEHRRIVSGHVSGGVELECQRCLQPMTQPLDSDFRLAIVYNDDMAKALPSDDEPLMLLPDEALDPATIVEEELLLSLPLQAMHNETECRIQTEFAPGADEQGSENPQPARENPFQVLASLKKD
ncbi:YceD family protein [bacterium]|nr:YceD family protein [bacterium]